MEGFSNLSDRRRKEVRDGAGYAATVGLVRVQKGLTETQGDAIESAALPLALLMPPWMQALLATDVVAFGSPYEKENQQKAA